MRRALPILLALAALSGCASVPSDERQTLAESAVGGCADGVAFALTEALVGRASTDAGVPQADAGEQQAAAEEGPRFCAYCQAHGWRESAGCFGARNDCEGLP